MSESQIHTYHCICSELIIATHRSVPDLPQRELDKASICRITLSDAPMDTGSAAFLTESVYHDTSATILKLEDGFEKRYAAKCKRCELQIGYWLDKSQFQADERGPREDVLYLLAGGLVETQEMSGDKKGDTKDS